MKLLEPDVKRLFKEQGIPVPRHLVVPAAEISKGIATPWRGASVVKAVVPFGSRFKKGLIRIVENPGHLADAAEEIVDRSRSYGGCRAVLIEERIEHPQESYLSIVSDPIERGPVLLYAPEGGVDVEHLAQAQGLCRHPIDIGSEPGSPEVRAGILTFFQSVGADPAAADRLTNVAERMYVIYRRWSCLFVEINPLVRSAVSEIALDAKMEIDDDAAELLDPEAKAFAAAAHIPKGSLRERAAERIDHKDYRGTVHFVETDRDAAARQLEGRLRAFVGFNGIGTGVSLTAMDELVRAGFFPANFCDTSGNPTASKLYRATRIILSQPAIGGYFFISCISSQQLDNTARGIIKAFKEKYARTGGVPEIPSLLLFRGAWEDEAIDLFKQHGIAGPTVRILGRESSERDAVRIFGELYDGMGSKIGRKIA